MLRLVLVAIVSYFVGGFPTGVVLTRRRYGLDVREMGSGNIGATNVTRVFGWSAGVFTFLIDVLKGAVPLLLVQKFFPGEDALMAVCGSFLVLGHCYSPYLKLKGGKGVATGFGVLLVVLPWAALFSGVVYVALLLTTKISAVGSLGGMITTILYLFFTHPESWRTMVVVCVAFVVLARHKENIIRLLKSSKTKKS